MAHLWQNDGLQKMNYFLSEIERQKKIDEKLKEKELARVKLLAGELILNPRGFNTLKESNIWSRTQKEDKKINAFREDMASYLPRRAVQRKVMSFATGTEARKYTKIEHTVHDIDEYIDKSNYWIKNSVEIKPASGDKRIKIVYASNEQMECIIFEYLRKYVVSTVSSFENHLRAIEGKDLIHEWVVSGSSVDPIETPVKHKDVIDIMKSIDDFNAQDDETEAQKIIKKLTEKEVIT